MPINRTLDKRRSTDPHIQNYNNPHRVTAAQLGLENLVNIEVYSQDKIDQLLSEVEADVGSVSFANLEGQISDNQILQQAFNNKADLTALLEHINNQDNPHNVDIGDLDVYTKDEADAKFLDEDNNLSDLTNVVTAQTNLHLRNGTADLTVNTLQAEGQIVAYTSSTPANQGNGTYSATTLNVDFFNVPEASLYPLSGGSYTRTSLFDTNTGQIADQFLPDDIVTGSIEWDDIGGPIGSNADLSDALDGKANVSGTYANLRAQATTAGDVGLGNVRNVSSYSQNEADNRFLNEASNLGDLDNVLTAQTNLKLKDGTADLNVNTLNAVGEIIAYTGGAPADQGNGVYSADQLGVDVLNVPEASLYPIGSNPTRTSLFDPNTGEIKSQFIPSGGGGGASSLNDLSDVTVSSPTTGQVLVNDGSIFGNAQLTFSQIGGSLPSHTHTESDITDLGNYSTVGHTHDYLPLSGGTMSLGEGLQFLTGDIGRGNDTRIIRIKDGNTPNAPDGNIMFTAGDDDNAILELWDHGVEVHEGSFLWNGNTVATTNQLYSGDTFNSSGTYSGLRAQSTTKSDVGLGNVPNSNNLSSFVNGPGYYNSGDDVSFGTGTFSGQVTAATSSNEKFYARFSGTEQYAGYGFKFSGGGYAGGFLFDQDNNEYLLSSSSATQIKFGGGFEFSAGDSGGTFRSDPFKFEHNSNLFFHVLSPSTTERGFLFGDEANQIQGGILFNHIANGVTIRTGGNTDRVNIDENGNMAIGDFLPSYKLDVAGDLRTSGISYADNHRDPSDLRLKEDISWDCDPLAIADHAHLIHYKKTGNDYYEFGLPAQYMERAHSDMIGWQKHEEFDQIRTLSGLSVASVALSGVGKLNRKQQTQTQLITQLRGRIAELEQKLQTLR